MSVIWYHPILCTCFLAYCFYIFFYFLFLKHPCVLQHAALSEYRPILANRPQSHSSSMADMKLTLIPIIFIALRIWSTVRFILLLANSPVRWNPVLVTLHVSSKFLFTRGCPVCVCVALCVWQHTECGHFMCANISSYAFNPTPPSCRGPSCQKTTVMVWLYI